MGGVDKSDAKVKNGGAMPPVPLTTLWLDV
jgi:hypothetical protein